MNNHISVFAKDSQSMKRLEESIEILKELNPDQKFWIETVLFDDSQQWYWTTILSESTSKYSKGMTFQYLNPNEQNNILNTAIELKKYLKQLTEKNKTRKQDKKMKPTVYACFAGLGKSTLAKKNKHFIDLESSEFQWIYLNHNHKSLTIEQRKSITEKEKNSEFPNNYITKIKHQLNDGHSVLISCQPEVFTALIQNGIEFTIITPNHHLIDDYIDRYRKRNNNEKFIEIMNSNFHNFVDDLTTNLNSEKTIIINKPHTYLSNILDK